MATATKGGVMNRRQANSSLAWQPEHMNMTTTIGEDQNNSLSLPRINNSMDLHSISERDSKKYSNNIGSKSVEHPRMGTVPIETTNGNIETQANMAVPDSVRVSVESISAFDTKKWKRMINGNVDMIQKKVD